MAIQPTPSFPRTPHGFGLLADICVGDTTFRYLIEPDSGQVGLIAFPTAMAGQLAIRRRSLKGEPFIDAMPGSPDIPAITLDPLVHLKLVGDGYPGAFATGRTMRASASNGRFRFKSQTTHRGPDGETTVLTTLASAEGLEIEHALSWYDGDGAVTIGTTLHNRSSDAVKVEMLTSFSLSGITPFHSSDAPERLEVHRFRSVWSAEARLETKSVEALHLERSWSGAGGFSERFGQLGSMPVRGFFPFVAVTDKVARVTWGAQLAWAGSWQMEVFRQHDDLCISGGLADRELGHWMKTLAPGESLASPLATLACVEGDVQDVCARLVAKQNRAVEVQPAVEQDLPVIFNEWCTTWGDPAHDKVVAIAERLRNSGVRYLVIDAGWYKTEKGDWGNGHGDWVPSSKLFPQGLRATAEAIRERGLIPGLWFEMETVGTQSDAFREQVKHLVHRDGLPLCVRERRFWNLTDPAAVKYLTERVIGLLREGGFGYTKIDYNETIGLGIDHADSLGEGLRLHVEGVHWFFETMRRELPELVIENCSSGGHRLEPSMLARTAMSSFSDAHELVEIPLIAANLHQLILPRQNQIWAVLHPTASDRRLTYLLTATFLGRMCLSGDVVGLSAAQWQLVREGIDAYRWAAPVIKAGTSRLVAHRGESWRHPTGHQVVCRTSVDGSQMLVVIHTFEGAPNRVGVSLPSNGWVIKHQFPANSAVGVEGAELGWIEPGDFAGQVVSLEKA